MEKLVQNNLQKARDKLMSYQSGPCKHFGHDKCWVWVKSGLLQALQDPKVKQGLNGWLKSQRAVTGSSGQGLNPFSESWEHTFHFLDLPIFANHVSMDLFQNRSQHIAKA